MRTRTKWASEHPWLASAYYGFLMSATFGLLASRRDARMGVISFIVLWPAVTLFAAAAHKHRFGERPDAETHPAPSLRRIWSRGSDRVLFWLMLACIASAVAWLSEVLAGSGNAIVAVFWFGVSVLAVVSLATERRLRGRSSRSTP